MGQATKKLLKYFILPVALLNIVGFFGLRALAPDFLLHLNFYDIGQGDAMLIETYLGNQILIDGGPSNLVLQQVGRDMPFFDRTIELVMLTHAHADHVSGLVDVLKRYKVKKIILSEVEFHSATYDQFIKLIEEKKIEKIYASRGQRIYLDNATVFDVYFPQGKVLGADFHDGFSTSSSDLNDTSVVGKLSFGKTKILFTGDAGTNIEHMLLPEFNLDSDLLKVGHHGSRHSTSAEFLSEVTPQYAIISVGKNSYGHPTEETLNNLKQAKAEILRTDEDHTIRFISNGVDLYRK